jgi:SAM-dependent methyltransferase
MRRPLRSFDRIAGVYDATRSAPAHVASALTAALVRVLRETADPPQLLEVGIGTGRIAVPLAAAGVRVTGVDISRRMLEVLRGKRSQVRAVLAEAAQLPFRAGSFDAALFVHVLHLVPEIDATLQAAMGVVRPGGAVIHVSEDPEPGGPHLEANRMLWDVVEERTREKRPADVHAEATAAFERGLGESGAAVELRRVIDYDAPFQPRRALEHLRRRDFSSHWRIPEAALADVVAALEQRFVERWGDLDVERPSRWTLRSRVARLP